MNPGSYKRKISAMWSADVAGYSRLMGDDEEKTVQTNAFKFGQRALKLDESNAAAHSLIQNLKSKIYNDILPVVTGTYIDHH